MKKITYFILAASSLLISLTSCEKTNESPNRVNFTSSFANFETKAARPFTNGYKAIIYGYEEGSLISYVNNQFPALATSNNGVLKTSPALSLPKDTYDFYCLSKNNASLNNDDFTINNGKTQQLEHNADYIFAEKKKFSISGNSDVNFELEHLCSKITITLNANTSQNVSNLDVTNLGIKLPEISNNAGKLDFNTGIISKCSNIEQTYTSISTTESNSYTYIILPCSDGELAIELTANLNIGGTAYTDKIFKANTTIPTGYQPGKHYIINASIGAKVLNFSTTTVEEWITTPLSNIEFTEE